MIPVPSRALTLFAGLALSGCVTDYGYPVPAMYDIVVTSRDVQRYWLIREDEYLAHFAERPQAVSVYDERAKFFKTRFPLKANAEDFGYRAGAHYLAFLCANQLRFRPLAVKRRSKVQAFTISCT